MTLTQFGIQIEMKTKEMMAYRGFKPSYIHKDALLSLILTCEAWQPIRKAVEQGYYNTSGIDLDWKRLTVEAMLDRVGIDLVTNVGGTLVAVDITVGAGKARTKRNRMVQRHAAYMMLGITASVVLQLQSHSTTDTLTLMASDYSVGQLDTVVGPAIHVAAERKDVGAIVVWTVDTPTTVQTHTQPATRTHTGKVIDLSRM